ncbi:MAG: D-cysteine desulfhydrase family protein [Halieaceae bacterium]|jgi:D-cysteine desulfhydrase|nr:D-cysteine desulfhydrase family protein [Halieaceae bacterium]
MELPERIPLARLPTPLQPMPRLGEHLGIRQRLWVKRDDLTDTAISGNKLRKLEFVAAEARRTGCDTLITCGGVQSNHCRAAALVGARLGFKVHLILRGVAPDDIDGNLLLDHLAGAAVSHYEQRDYVQNLPALFEQWRHHYAERGHKAMCIPTGASDGIGLWGYLCAAQELGRDMASVGIERAHWVFATGSGGTQAGLTLGAAVHGVPATAWGVNVCDDEAWFLNKVAEDIEDWRRRYPQTSPVPDVQARVLDGYVGPGYGRADPVVFDTIALVARTEGLVLDPVYTGKAFHGMLEELSAGRFDDCEDVVFVHTGGLFGVFPQRAGFRFA